jgi:hypothetical protein
MRKSRAMQHLIEKMKLIFIFSLVIGLTTRAFAQVALTGQDLQQAIGVALARGDEALKRGAFDEAIFCFRLVAIDPQNWKNEEDTKAHRGLLAAYSGKGDMETTLFYANAIARNRKFANELLHMVMGGCYLELSQPTAAVDLLRLSASTFIADEASQLLALSLSQTPIPSLRDGKEALSWLSEQRDLADRDPRLAKIIALSAAESGDFELAVNMQKSLVDKISPKDRAAEESLIELYEKKQKPKVEFPSFDRTQTLNQDELAKRAWNSMVYVNVSGLATDGVTDEESTIVKVVKYRHMGIVLNKMGTILVSSESTDLPHIVDGDLGSPKAKRWIKEPSFSVWSIVDPSGTAQEIGAASLVGVDSETGLAVLQCEREGLEHEPIAEIEPIRFQPEYRWHDPTWLEFSKSYFELNDFRLVEREGGHLETRSYPLSIANPQVFGTTAHFVACEQSQAAIGAPLLNAFGECIGLVRSLKNRQTPKVAIPSAVCSRVASKLCAFGFVPRVHSPMVVSSVSKTRKLASGKTEIVRSGMYVSELRSPNPALADSNSPYQKLVDQVILTVDGHPTPTHTEWLIALERIAFADWAGEEIELEVVDTEWENRRTVQVRFAPVIEP